MKKLKPKVTIASVRRQWQTKYNELNERYERLCNAHMELARAADKHCDESNQLEAILEKQNKLAFDRLVETHRLQGIILYLEGKLNEKDD